MKKDYQDQTPSISLTVLASLCFVTLLMCQTRFKISKEMRHEIYPPVLRSKDCWFLYTIGNPDRFKCVLRACIVISSPVLSLISTGLLLFGKIESNPYFFIPWLLLTIKGLLLIQTDNLITILRDMTTRSNYTYGFRMEDFKWIFFYFTIFLIDLVEAFSFCEVFDLFLVLWNHHPGYNIESASLEAVKKEIADILETLSKCSLRSLSKISLGTITDSEEITDTDLKELGATVKFSLKDEGKVFDENKHIETLSNGDSPNYVSFDQGTPKKDSEKECLQVPSLNLSEGDASAFSCNELDFTTKSSARDSSGDEMTCFPKKLISQTELKIENKNVVDNISIKSSQSDVLGDSINQQIYPLDILCL